LAVVTDSAPEAKTLELVRGVSHLLHEAWLSVAETTETDKHSTGADAGRVAAAASVGRLTLIHLHPLSTNHQQVLLEAREHFPAAELGQDRQRLIV
jgi:ribonuclease BN (tRNA processing enzyme)